MCELEKIIFICGHLKQVWTYCSDAVDHYVPISDRRARKVTFSLPIHTKNKASSSSTTESSSSQATTSTGEPSSSSGAATGHHIPSSRPLPEPPVRPASSVTSTGSDDEDIHPTSTSFPSIPADQVGPLPMGLSSHQSLGIIMLEQPVSPGSSETRLRRFRVFKLPCELHRKTYFREAYTQRCEEPGCDFERVDRCWRCCCCGMAPVRNVSCWNGRDNTQGCGHTVCMGCEAFVVPPIPVFNPQLGDWA